MVNGDKKTNESDTSQRDKTVCFAGHRRINKSNIENIALRLDRVIEKLIKQGIIYFGCGGAKGFDYRVGMKRFIKYEGIELSWK